VRAVKFYHSMICPRCRLSGIWLKQLLPEFPEVEIERVELLTNRARARDDGVRLIPTLIAGEKKLSGFYLTKKAIRRFLESL
jgi:hypothetical protein